MKRLLFIALLIPLLCSQNSQAQFNMPSLPDAAKAFLSKYHFDSDTSRVVFQRQREGWFIAEESYFAFDTYFNKKLFWSLASRQYLDLDYPESHRDTAALARDLDSYLQLIDWSNNERLYNRIIYYQYPGWNWDIIQDFSNKTALSDTLLESLARAYSSYATGYVEPGVGPIFINGDTDRVTLDAGPLPVARVKKFQQYMDKALETYQLLARQNPNYTVWVGNVNVKLANEYMFAAMEMSMGGYSKESNRYASLAQFPDSILKRTTAYLRDVSPGALLLTNGDNDTYSLWYLQQVKNLRKDVTIINHTMLSIPNYLLYLNKKRLPQPLFSARYPFYEDPSSGYFVFGNKSDTMLSIDVGKFLVDLRNVTNPYDTDIYETDGVIHPKYYSTRLYFTTDQHKRSLVFRLGEFIMRGDYALLDILHTNRKRKIYFTYTDTPVLPLLKRHKSVYELKLN